MPPIKEFPDDDTFRMVKWMDDFVFPWKDTQTAAIVVHLQVLTAEEAEKARVHNDAYTQSVIQAARSDTPTKLISVRVLAPLASLMRIGEIYRGQRLFGLAHMRTTAVEMPRIIGQDEDARLSSSLAIPPGWMGRKYFLLNRTEYEMDYREFSGSYTVNFQVNGTTYIIPSTVLFHFYFAAVPVMAHAFTRGPFSITSEDLICPEIPTWNLRTEERMDPHTLQVLLQRGISPKFAIHLAIVYFGYGRICANAIYGHAQQTKVGELERRWFMRARIPFDPALGPVRVRLRGWRLRNILGVVHGVPQNKFLVTQILGSSTPPMPPIGWEQVVGTTPGDQVEEVSGASPQRRSHEVDPISEDALVVNDQDADAGKGPRSLDANLGMWLNRPETFLLKKAVTKHYTEQAGPPHRAAEGGSTTVSAGAKTYRRDAPAVLRENEEPQHDHERFEAILTALDDLEGMGALASYSVHTANPDMKRSIQRYPHPTWAFQPLDQTTDSTPPSRNWRVIERRLTVKGYVIRPRVALVLWLEGTAGSAYWIEIECHGQRTYEAVLMTSPPEDIDPALVKVLDAIADHEGSHLTEHLPTWSLDQQVGTLLTLRHQFERGAKRWNLGWLRERLTEAGVLVATW